MHPGPTTGSTLLLAAAALVAPAFGAASPLDAASEPAVMPMEDYLGFLAQVSPAAHAGARAYLDAHRRRCGRNVTSGELRAAMAIGTGDPALMAMIRASHLRDAASLARAELRIPCRRARP
jgi:hypothetical protein